ncbi:DUF4350 domain-containing protein [Mucilaginibacter agri]|uniref:DUF4350 domain-containing protein n=1 Tax=Mucilaginibacter agri TaxID=2695265 RepID=A0A965ZMA5_9SPHI|nr:DUF4350 domain-containing protein [Mucilaginibacter agri]NCD72316.1 DUF4350 domain-containing protein [Mucilaginibacter agri]
MKDLKIYIVIASLLLVGYIVVQYNRPKTIDWTQTLNNDDKIPFGTYILFNRLHDIFPGANVQTFREPVYNVISDHGNKPGTYIIICGTANINEYDYNKLVRYLKNGSNVFIAAKDFGTYIKKNLKVETYSDPFNNHNTPVHFLNKYVDSTEYYNTDKYVGNSYFSKIDTAKAIVLGENGSHQSNFIKFNIGKGALYLSANPLLFSNYNILQPKGANYAAIALSNLKNTKDIFWDEYYTQGRTGQESLMRVFLRDPLLRSAFYIAFFSLLIFVLYEMKRRQRIIPIIEPLSNTSAEFAKVVGQVYYEQRNNNNIAQKKATYFLEFVRTHYYLKTNQLSDEFTRTLAQKSGADLALLQNIIAHFIMARTGQPVSDRELIELNQNIEQFYIQSR